MLPRYLFRSFSSSSQGTNSRGGFFVHAPKMSQLSYEDHRRTLSNHLLWKPEDSPWISTTSSLLRALVFARWRCLQGQEDVRIAILDCRSIEANTAFPATYLAQKHNLDSLGKPWHDTPDGEYLVWGKIERQAVFGVTTYNAVSKQIEFLLPELADKSHQLTEDLRNYYHGTQSTMVRAEKQGNHWPLAKEEYDAACETANAFSCNDHNLLVALMCLSFRKRDCEAPDLVDFATRFPSRNNLQAFNGIC